MQPGPGPAIWVAWGGVVLGGLLVLAATAIAITHPCLGTGGAPLSVACSGSAVGSVTGRLAIGGTGLSALGAVTAVSLTVRRVRSLLAAQNEATGPSFSRGL